jgi:hypothetical protein
MIIKDWITNSGLRAVVYLLSNNRHYCGYVEILSNHPLFGIYHHQSHECLSKLSKECKDRPIGDRGILSLFRMAFSGDIPSTPEACFDVHGSITFSAFGKNGYPITSEGFWYGFDCGHLCDTKEIWNAQAVELECERFAEQLQVLQGT